MPFDNDGIITWDIMIERYNSDLANVLGNLVSRTISMSNKYFNGSVENKNITLNEEDKAFDNDLKNTIKKYGQVL